MEHQFVISWPVCILATKIGREPNGQMGIDQVFSATLDSGARAVPLFTDSDLANRFVREHQIKATIARIPSPEALIAFLKIIQRGQDTHIVFDPATIGTPTSAVAIPVLISHLQLPLQ